MRLRRKGNGSDTMCISEWKFQGITIITGSCIIPKIYMHPPKPIILTQKGFSDIILCLITIVIVTKTKDRFG